MNSTSLCKDCGHSQTKHDSAGMCHFLSLVDELDWETRHCQCRFFRPEPAPEKDSNVVRDFMADGIKLGMDLGTTATPDSVDKIVEEFSTILEPLFAPLEKILGTKKPREAKEELLDHIRTVFVSHGKAEREKGREAAILGEEHITEAHERWKNEGFTKGIEAGGD